MRFCRDLFGNDCSILFFILVFLLLFGGDCGNNSCGNTRNNSCC